MSSFLRLFRFFSGFKRVPYLVGNTRVLFISEGQSSALAKDQEEDPILLWHQADTAKVNTINYVLNTVGTNSEKYSNIFKVADSIKLIYLEKLPNI